MYYSSFKDNEIEWALLYHADHQLIWHLQITTKDIKIQKAFFSTEDTYQP